MAGAPSCRSVRRNQNKHESRPYDRNFGIRAERNLKVKQLAKFAIWGLVLPNGPLPADAVRQLYHKKIFCQPPKCKKERDFSRSLPTAAALLGYNHFSFSKKCQVPFSYNSKYPFSHCN